MSPAIAPARVVDRVQGIDSSLSDLTLRDGRRLAIEIGGAITGRPELTRAVDGGSSVKLSIRDHDLNFLQESLLAEKWDANIDGLRFRYMGADLGESSIDLTLKDRDIAILEEFTEPVSALRKETTRAEFIVSLVRKARPHAPITCPQLHDIQPIESNRQAKKAKDDAKAERGKGLGDGKGLTMDGAPVDQGQVDLADMALRIATSAKAPDIVKVAVIEALMAESGLGKASPGNVLQALGPGGAMIRPAAEEISGFITGKPTWTGVTAIGYAKAHPDAPAHEIAQAVQKSAFSSGSNYGKFEAEARAFVEAFGGGEYSGVISTEGAPEPYVFEVGSEKRGENWWEAIKRLAEEVNWRAFWVAGRFFYMDELELFRGMVRLAIDRETKGIQKVTGSWRANRRATEMTVEAFAERWRVPPGAVVTVAEYGPFSKGFGDAPLRKGQKIAISSNRKAATGEGRARYLVESIGIPLRDSDNGKLKRVSVKLRKPTAPLPEPAAEQKTVSTKSGGTGFTGGTGDGTMGVLEGTPEDIVNQVVDYAHANGFPAVTRESVRVANAAHSTTTTSGSISDHKGPPTRAWAADISNGGSPTPEMDALAAAIAKAFGIPWSGEGLVSHSAGGYRMQLIYRTDEGGNHFNHVHFGVSVG